MVGFSLELIITATKIPADPPPTTPPHAHAHAHYFHGHHTDGPAMGFLDR